MTHQLKDGSSVDDPRLDRLIPPDFRHVERYPARAALGDPVPSIERTLLFPRYRPRYDQGSEGACVGFAASWGMSILNRRLYAARWLYHEAQKIDSWPGGSYEGASPVYEGTSVRAGLEVLRTVGHRRIYNEEPQEPDPAHGVKEYRWAQTVDEIRTSISIGSPVVLGIGWYTNFDRPEGGGRIKWIGKGDLGRVRGGHAICCYGASDARQAVKLINSWGLDYPLVWMPYKTVERLLNEYGEAGLVVDA